MILLVGGTGTLGQAVAARLLGEGERVRVMTRAPASSEALGSAGAELVAGDLLDRASLARACRGVRSVVAAAHSMLGWGRSASANVDGRGHRDLIDAAAEAGVRHFVYTSVYDLGPAHRRIPFFRIKYETEAYLAGSGVPYTILRATAFMEVHAHMLIGVPVIEKGVVAVFGSGVVPRNFVAAEDVGRFAVLALREPALINATLDVGGPENLSNLDVVRLYERLAGRKARVLHVPLALLRAHPLVGLFHPGAAQLIRAGIVADTVDQSFDAAPLQQRFGLELTRLEDWARRRVPSSAGRT
jgi:uncharacterized protein YbjT (DUF2867 family)